MHSKPSIKLRLQATLLVPTTIVLLLFGAFFVIHQWRTARQGNERRLEMLGVVIAENIASSLAFRDAEDAQKVLTALHVDIAVREAVLYDGKGKKFASYRAGDAAVYSPDSPGKDGLFQEGEDLILYRPVVQGDLRYGTLYVRWDLAPLYRDIVLYAVTVVFLLAGALILAVVIGRVFQQSISDPILSLADTAQTIANAKDYSVRVSLPDTAELGVLAKALNHMLEETQAGHTRLAREVEATKRAEKALRASEEQLRLITDASPALISYIDSELRYRFVNKQYETWFGHPREEILGHTMSEVLGEAAVEKLLPHVRRALDGEYVHFEIQVPYREVGARWVDIHYIPHRIEGSVAGLVVLVLDMTERKRIEEALDKARGEMENQNQKLELAVTERTSRLHEVIQELEAFSYSIAHDMRAPLRSMQGFSRLLLEDHAGHLNDEGRAFLKRIIASADRLDRLITDVLNYSRVVRADIPMEPVNLHRLVGDIVATYPQLQPPRAEIKIEGQLPYVHANTAALTQVFSNLLGNAVKFVNPGTHPVVHIAAETAFSENGSTPPWKWTRVWIQDNGIGIPKDAQHRLFGMFQRLNRPELYEGTGMGLAIVRKAIERMGGSVGVESTEGRGSRFWIKLKCTQDP